MACKYLTLLAVVALLASATLVRCQDDAEPQVISFGEHQPEPAAEAVQEPIPAATPTPAAAAAPTPAAAAGSLDAYKELAKEYLHKATETATVYVAQAQELAHVYMGQAQDLLSSTLDKLGMKKPAGRTEL